MRRSSAVKLTLLPMLASAAVAAQPAPDEPPLQPPGATAPMLSPPGLTPAIDECQDTPDDPPCPPEESEEPEDQPEQVYLDYLGGGGGGFGGFIHRRLSHHHHGVFRGGFGHYFGAAGG